MKQLITWTDKQVNNNKFSHPNSDQFANLINPTFTFHETGYSGPKNPVLTEYIGILEYDESKTVGEIAQYKSGLASYQIKDKTEAEVNELLNTWYNGEVTVSNYIFTDTRPEPTL